MNRVVGDRTRALEGSAHRSGTVPGSHRLRDHTGWSGTVPRRAAGRPRERCRTALGRSRSLDECARSPRLAAPSAGLDLEALRLRGRREGLVQASAPGRDKSRIRAAGTMAASPSSRQQSHPPEEVNLMVESRWLRWIGPGVVALGAVGLDRVHDRRRGTRRPGRPRPCAGPPADRRRRGPRTRRRRHPRISRRRRGSASTRSRPTTGRSADSGWSSAASATRLTRTLDLPAESFAAGPFGRIVLVGSDDGSTSRLEAVDVASGCSWPVADGARRHPAGDDRPVRDRRLRDARRSRRRVPTSASGAAGSTRHRRPSGSSAPIAPDARFGRTFSTEFTWDLAGDRLAVQSCGEVACRTRLLDPRWRPGRDARRSPISGSSSASTATGRDVRGLPRPPLPDRLDRHHDRRATGRSPTRPAPRRSSDRPTAPGSSTRCGPVTGASLRSVALDGGGSPRPGPARATTSASPGRRSPADRPTRLPPAGCSSPRTVAFPIDPADHRPQLRHIPDGATVPLDEAVR